MLSAHGTAARATDVQAGASIMFEHGHTKRQHMVFLVVFVSRRYERFFRVRCLKSQVPHTCSNIEATDSGFFFQSVVRRRLLTGPLSC